MAARLGRFGVGGLGGTTASWEVVVSQAPEPRWTGTDPRRTALQSAYQLAVGGWR